MSSVTAYVPADSVTGDDNVNVTTAFVHPQEIATAEDALSSVSRFPVLRDHTRAVREYACVVPVTPILKANLQYVFDPARTIMFPR